MIKSYSSEEKTSEIVPLIFKEIEKNFKIEALFYAKGPGSFMSIKISYIFLKTFSIVNDIPLFATDGFYFNNNAPIKAICKMFFIKDGDNIILDKITPKIKGTFSLPTILKEEDFTTDTLPLYILPAV